MKGNSSDPSGGIFGGKGGYQGDIVLKSPGLKIKEGINEIYGPEFTGEDSATLYSCCLRATGQCCAIGCCVCATCSCGPVTKIDQGFIGLLIEFGKLKAKLGPGLHTVNPCSQKVIKVDTRVQSKLLPKQILLTKDSVTVTIDLFINFRIVIPEFALYKSSDYYDLLCLMISAVMKTIVAERTLSQLLVNRKEIEKSTAAFIEERAHPFGVDVVSIETQSIQLPVAMERVMAIVAESEKRAEAKVIDAKGNLESAKIFREASDELLKNPLSIELQYFETLKAIAAENPSTIVVPDSIMSTVNQKIAASKR